MFAESEGDESLNRLILYNVWNTAELPFPIERCSSHRDWVTAAGSWPYKCLPLRIAAEAGWCILSPVQFTATWDGSSAPKGVTLTYERGKHFNCIGTTFGLGILTFNIPYIFRTPPDVNLWVHGPVNWFSDGIQPLDGIVETDWSDMKFTMNWKLTRPFHSVRIFEGDPICVITPYPRHFLEGFKPEIRQISTDPDFERQYRTWTDRRQAHIQAKRTGALPPKHWQKDYYLGRNQLGSSSKAHQTRLHLAEFKMMERHQDDEEG